MMKILILVLRVIHLSYAQIDKHELVPDIIDKYPGSILEVIYKDNVIVQEGKELTPTMVHDPPTVKWEADANDFYLLIMDDPDAPSRADPKLREFLHWMVGNIPGCDLSKGEVIAAYLGAGPPLGTGLHRYAQFLYKQPGKIDFSHYPTLNDTSIFGRAMFNLRGFAKENNLGEPVAINMFQAQYDSYVPTLHKQLNFNP